MHGNEKILFVDDEQSVLSSIRRMLMDEPYEQLFASGGKDALDLLENNNVNVIISDMRMPIMDGYEATRKLNNDASTRDIPIVFVSSKSQKADKLWAQMQGGKGYVTKPYTADKIISQLKSFN